MSGHDKAYIERFQPPAELEVELETLLTEMRKEIVDRDKYRNYLVNFKALWTVDELAYIKDQYRRCVRIIRLQVAMAKTIRTQIWILTPNPPKAMLWAEFHDLQRRGKLG